MQIQSAKADASGLLLKCLAAALLASQLSCLGCASHNPGKPTLDEVVARSREGVPAPHIVEMLRDAGAVYIVTASDLIRLHDEGVSDPVLDYIQEAYVAKVKEAARLKNLMTGKGPGVNK